MPKKNTNFSIDLNFGRKWASLWYSARDGLKINKFGAGELLRNTFISIKFEKPGTYSYILTNLEELII